MPLRPNTTVRAALVCGSLMAVAGACSSDHKSAATTAPTSTARRVATTTTTTTTTTTAAATTLAATTSTTEAATTTTDATTTTTVPGPPVYPLTGVLVDDPVAAGRQALIVKIDNASAARPQTGFNEADIVFEEIVNDHLTRFAMIFQSGDSDPVGPIRSGRIQDIDLFGSLRHPLFAWSGGNATVTAAIGASDLVDIGPSRAAVYFRTRDRVAPHNLYSTTQALWSQTTTDAQPPPQQFQYRAAGVAAAGSPSTGVDVTLDSVDVGWRWDAAGGVYRRTMEGREHDDAANGQVTTNNVIVLSMDYQPGISGSPDAQTIGSGEAWVFTGGNLAHGRWSHDDRLRPYALTADDGTPIALTPGRTFIELPRDDGVNVAPIA